MNLSLGRIAEFTDATGEFDLSALAQGYSIDSRTVQSGNLFFAVKGERLNGHDYVEQALTKGAVAAVIRKDQLVRYPVKANLLAVDDTLVALQALATGVRKLWGKTAIGITGSMGKTTTKDALAHLLSTRHRVHSSKGNFNNHFGLPLGLLKLEPEHDLAVGTRQGCQGLPAAGGHVSGYVAHHARGVRGRGGARHRQRTQPPARRRSCRADPRGRRTRRIHRR
jgi:UDP-N-acetylmuramoyl-tripeptide--D-alanyl-D-alanine ligase